MLIIILYLVNTSVEGGGRLLNVRFRLDPLRGKVDGCQDEVKFLFTYNHFRSFSGELCIIFLGHILLKSVSSSVALKD